MKLAINDFALIPLRNGLSHQSEMISQILFGEIIEILQKRDSWVRIKLLFDNYEGWIDNSQYNLSEFDSDLSFVEKYNKHSFICPSEIIIENTGNSQKMRIPAGSKIPSIAIKSKQFSINQENFVIVSKPLVLNGKDPRKIITEVAESMLNTPYIWGGRSSFGFDCSGFTQFLYSLAGIYLPRDASQQFEFGSALHFVNEAQTGDIAFFENEEGLINHTGIVLENGKIIHASGKVKIDIFDHQGIFNKKIKKYSHKLTVIKKII